MVGYLNLLCTHLQGTKKDRQPEFTQLDVELSFVDRQGVKSLVEELIVYCLQRLKQSSFLPEIEIPFAPFPTMTYDQAMSSYGSDKPDTRFDLRIVDVTSAMTGGGENEMIDCGSNVLNSCLNAGGSVKCVRVENGKKLLNKAEWNDLVTVKNESGENLSEGTDTKDEESSSSKIIVAPIDENLVFINVKSDSTWKTSSHARFLTPERQLRVNALLDARPDDVILMTHGVDDDGARCVTLGKLRLAIAKTLKAKGKPVYDAPFAWLWVDDFPLFLPAEDDVPDQVSSAAPKLESAHHPFTAPHPDDAYLLDSEPLRCRGLHYDLVLNGNEIGGGSIRIHDGAFQRRILTEFLGEEGERMEHLLRALDSGAPPHGGIALGKLLCWEIASAGLLR